MPSAVTLSTPREAFAEAELAVYDPSTGTAALATSPDPLVHRRIDASLMHGIVTSVAEDQHFVLSSLPPSPAQKRLALDIVLGLMIALYLVIGPFGGMQLGVIHSFVAVYTTAMFVTDSITAILLYAQFSILRSRAILIIASGYLFSAFLIVPYVLAFPGVLAPNGVVGGLQTTAHLYLLWHCGFPAFVIGYALLKDERRSRRCSQVEVSSAILRSIALTAAGAAAAMFVCIKS